MKLVEFENGKFGIRLHWWFGWYFRDLRDTSMMWTHKNQWFSHCQGSREEAEKCLVKKPLYRVVRKEEPEEGTIKHSIWKRKPKAGKRMIQL